MGIFDRLSRLARAEANDLFDSVSESAQGAFRSGDRARRSDGRPSGDPAAGAADDGIPPQVREDYAALELPLGADREAVKDAYRELMRRYHPDLHTSDPAKADLANELTVRIRQSYERLDAYLARQS